MNIAPKLLGFQMDSLLLITICWGYSNMANGNPFYVHPGGDFTKGLSGLGSIASGIAEKKRRDKAQGSELAARQEMMRAMRSGDPNLVADMALKYPGSLKEIQGALGIRQEGNEQMRELQNSEAVDFTEGLLSNPQNAEALYEDRINNLEAQGRDATQTKESYQDYLDNPEQELEQMELFYARLSPEGSKVFQERKEGLIKSEERLFQREMSRQDAELKRKEFALKDRALSLKREVLEKKNAGGGKLGDQDKFDIASKLRKEITENTKDFVKVRDAYGRIQAVDDTAAGDLALIFNFMKMLDPGSVVRESEFATAENTAGVPDRVRQRYNKILSGERLAPIQREAFKSQSNSLFKTQKKSAKRIYDQRVAIGKGAGVEESDLFGGVDYFEPRFSNEGESQSSIPQSAIDDLMADPSGEADFIEKFGSLPPGAKGTDITNAISQVDKR